jgi:hypothetical protein
VLDIWAAGRPNVQMAVAFGNMEGSDTVVFAALWCAFAAASGVVADGFNDRLSRNVVMGNVGSLGERIAKVTSRSPRCELARAVLHRAHASCGGERGRRRTSMGRWPASANGWSIYDDSIHEPTVFTREENDVTKTLLKEFGGIL